MQYLDNSRIICLTYAELVPAFMSAEAYKKARQRQTIAVHGRGGNGREVLVEFESLPGKVRDAVRKKYGEPAAYVAKSPLLAYLDSEVHADALDFYTTYELPNGKSLPDNYIPKYARAASWLRGIALLSEDKRQLKNTFKMSVMDFWGMVEELIKSNDVSIPASRKRLQAELKKFKEEGYGCLIEVWRFGNDNSKKVKDELSMSLLLQMIAHPHQHDDTIIASKYNQWASESGRECITPGAVGYWRSKNAHLVTQGREGNSKNYQKYSKRIHRDRASAPLLFVNSDDNILDLYFRNETASAKGKKQVNPYWRPALYVVTDTYNDYILGYAIGETVTIELIKAAYRNAMRHVMEMTGEPYLWHQIQTDRWGLDPKLEGELATWFKLQGHFTPATAKVAQAKYIERSFGTVWHQQLKMFPNYAGYNITSKERINPDAIERAKKDFPTKDQAPDVVELFINMMRQTVNPKSGKSRQQEWLDAVATSEKSKKKLLNEEVRLQIFGVQHPHLTKLSPSGINVTLNRQPMVYDIPDEHYLENVGKKVSVIYDPYDLSQVLVTDGKGLRFVAKEYENMPAALADFTEGYRTKLNNLLDGKKKTMETIGTSEQRRLEILRSANVDAQSLLQAGVLRKEIKHEAERVVAGYLPTNETEYFNPYQLM